MPVKTTYSYQISGGVYFPGDAVDIQSLRKEIMTAPLITIQPYSTPTVTVVGGVAFVVLVFKDALESQAPSQKAALDAVCAAHSGVPTKSVDVVSIAGPKTSDGKPVFTTARFRGDVNPQYPGAGDDMAGAARSAGPAFVVEQSLAGEGTLDFQFIDSVYVASGHAYTYNGASGDEVSFELVFPATPVVANGGGTGNCNLSDAGGALPAAVLIVPAAGDGTHDVDLSAALTPALAAKARGYPSLVTKACPVPAYDENADVETPNGLYEWDPKTGVITPSATPGAAPWNLYTVDQNQVKWVPRMQIADPGQNGRELNIEVDSKAKNVLPHWVFRVTLKTTDAARQVHLDWFLRIARKVMA